MFFTKAFIGHWINRGRVVGPFVHNDLTRKWAEDVGFDKEKTEVIARACIEIDKPLILKPWCHFAVFGAGLISYFLLFLAVLLGRTELLGYAIHCRQDSIGHGLIAPWNHSRETDDWNLAKTKTKEKIQRVTKRYLSTFKKWHPAVTTKTV